MLRNGSNKLIYYSLSEKYVIFFLMIILNFLFVEKTYMEESEIRHSKKTPA